MTRPIPEAHHERTLASRLEKRLLAYSAAATAAGVGLLASIQSAEAKIVYTPANTVIPTNTNFNLDLNNDGVPDFGFFLYTYGLPKTPPPLGYHVEGFDITPSKAANEVWIAQSGAFDCAVALPAGAKVGPGAALQAHSALLWDSAGTAYSGPYTFCKWGKLAHGAFLGLKFVINGIPHYAWAHVTLSGRSATLNGYAYETVPNTPIITGKTSGPISAIDISQPQPATLGLLARGSDGLQIWRREEQG